MRIEFWTFSTHLTPCPGGLFLLIKLITTTMPLIAVLDYWPPPKKWSQNIFYVLFLGHKYGKCLRWIILLIPFPSSFDTGSFWTPPMHLLSMMKVWVILCEINKRKRKNNRNHFLVWKNHFDKSKTLQTLIPFKEISIGMYMLLQP